MFYVYLKCHSPTHILTSDTWKLSLGTLKQKNVTISLADPILFSKASSSPHEVEWVMINKKVRIYC